MKLPLSTRRPRLDPGTFGASAAAHILVEKLNARGDAAVARRIVRLIEAYTTGLNEMAKMNNPPREQCMRWWKDQHYELGRPNELEQLGMLSYYDNILKTRLRQFLDQGSIVEILRDRDPDYSVIADELREMRLSQDKSG